VARWMRLGTLLFRGKCFRASDRGHDSTVAVAGSEGNISPFISSHVLGVGAVDPAVSHESGAVRESAEEAPRSTRAMPAEGSTLTPAASGASCSRTPLCRVLRVLITDISRKPTKLSIPRNQRS
jgi:hypothetical protein